MARIERGFSLLEVVVALALVGIGVVAVLLSMAQGRRNVFLTHVWAEEESRATGLLMSNLETWLQLRTDPGRRLSLMQKGQDQILGPWEWRAEPQHVIQGRLVDLYRVRLSWTSAGQVKEVETVATMRILGS